LNSKTLLMTLLHVCKVFLQLYLEKKNKCHIFVVNLM